MTQKSLLMPMELLETISSVLDELQIDRNGTLITALSGGADSIALTHALLKLGYKCIAAHCNFHLRGEESNRDQRLVETFCSSNDIACHIKHFDVNEYQLANSASVEMACRDLRYEWFESLRAETGAQAIAVAHHQDDNIETFMINLMRKTGIKGLRGMQSKNGFIIRPMLRCSRKQIERYIAENDLHYIVDSTNLQNDYTRNKIRNIILPCVYDVFPNAQKSISGTMEILSSADSFIDSALSSKFAEYADGNSFRISDMVNNEGFQNATFILYEWLRRRHDDDSICSRTNDILASKQTGRFFPTKQGVYVINRDILEYYDNSSTDASSRQFPFTIRTIDACDFSFKDDANVAYFDGSMLDGSGRLWSRHWIPGDRMRPYGMKGSKKLSDLFCNAKIAVGRKEQIPLLMLDDDILWVAGIRRSNLYPITSNTVKIIEIKYLT